MAGGVSVIGLGYDAQGNLANKNGVFYTFDYGNRMRAGGPETYRYDVQGRRIRSINSTGQVVYSLYAQSGQLLFQRDERSGKRRQYIYLGGSLVAESDLPLMGSTATVTYQHTDALGSPVATTNSSKTVLQRSEYEPYGYLLNRPMEDGPGYTGHVTDAATGLVYMQQRYMDPLIGQRFLTVDPVTAYSPGGAFNQYWYASANPYGFTDSDGRDPDPEMDPYRLSGGFVGVRSPGPYACEACETQTPSSSSSASSSDSTSASTSSATVDDATPVVTGEAVATVFKVLLDANGTAAGLQEQFLVADGMWRGANGKLYDFAWGGNQYAGARSLVLEKAGKLRALGSSLFYVSSAISIGQGISALHRKDWFGATRAGADIGWGAAATTGPAGMVGAAMYQGTSLLITIPAVNQKTVQPATDIMCWVSGSC
jgi:RHS repeat-associated protein